MEGFRRFVGVGIDEYDSTDFERLDYAVAEVRAVAELLRPGFVGEPLVDVTAEQVRDELELLPGSRVKGGVFQMAGEQSEFFIATGRPETGPLPTTAFSNSADSIGSR